MLTSSSPHLVSVGGKKFDSVTDDYCNAATTAFNDTNVFEKKGGMKAMGDVLSRGMVLVMSLWDDTSVNMLWLDAVDPPVPRANAPPGAIRGPCSIDSGKPSELQKDYPGAMVAYGDIKTGPLGSTFPSGPTPPGPPPPPTPPSPPGPTPVSNLT